MASRQAQKRLNKEYKAIQENPAPFVAAKPDEENILEWHYVITGPPGTPYENGQYHGLLRFPADYPFKPPSISMVTPNGRFSCNTRLCLSMSDYHPDTWNPAWSVSTILTGLLSFMTGEEHTTGSVTTTDAVKRKLASDSVLWNTTDNSRFAIIFPEILFQNKIEIERRGAEKKRLRDATLEATKTDFGSANVQLDMTKMDPEDRVRILAGQNDARRVGGDVILKVVGFTTAAILLVYFTVLGVSE